MHVRHIQCACKAHTVCMLSGMQWFGWFGHGNSCCHVWCLCALSTIVRTYLHAPQHVVCCGLCLTIACPLCRVRGVLPQCHASLRSTSTWATGSRCTRTSSRLRMHWRGRYVGVGVGVSVGARVIHVLLQNDGTLLVITSGQSSTPPHHPLPLSPLPLGPSLPLYSTTSPWSMAPFLSLPSSVPPSLFPAPLTRCTTEG